MAQFLEAQNMNEIDTDIIIAFFAATLVLLILSSFGIIFTIIHKKKQQANKNEKNLLKTRFQEELLQSQLEIKEQTLQHLAYELHDNLGQVASLIKINLNVLKLDDHAQATQKIEDTKELIRQLITDLKLLSVRLGSDKVTKLGIIKGLENEVERLNKTGLFKTTLQHYGAIPALDSNTTIILYRMVQEIINNIIKHSGAKTIDVSLKVVRNFFTLVINDDGLGFNMDEELTNGSGLTNLHNRAKLINATLLIDSSPKKGTKILIELPL